MSGSPIDEDAQIQVALRSLSDSYTALPSAVADRLDRVLVDLPPLEAPGAVESPVRERPRLSWWRRHGIASAVVLSGVALVAGIGVVSTLPANNSGNDSAVTSPNDTEMEDLDNNKNSDESVDSTPPETEPSSIYTVTYSGHDYERGGEMTFTRSSNDVDISSSIDDSLTRLAADPVALSDCVGVVTDRFDGSVTSVDFGTFESQPALVIVIKTDDGSGDYVAVGAGCGTDGNMDFLYSQSF